MQPISADAIAISISISISCRPSAQLARSGQEWVSAPRQAPPPAGRLPNPIDPSFAVTSPASFRQWNRFVSRCRRCRRRRVFLDIDGDGIEREETEPGSATGGGGWHGGRCRTPLERCLLKNKQIK